MTTPLALTDNRRLEALASILIRAFVITIVAMTFVWVVAWVAGEPIRYLHRLMFDISGHEFELFLYGFLTFIKCLNVVLFLFPWIAIRWYLMGANRIGGAS